MKSPALLQNKLADIEEKAFVLFQKLAEMHFIRKNTMDIKYKDLRDFRCNVIDKKEKDIINNLEKLKVEESVIKEQLKLLMIQTEEDIECL